MNAKTVKLLSCLIPTKKLRHKFRSLFYENNRIIIVSKKGKYKQVNKIPGLDVRFDGTNSTIEIHGNNKFYNCKITVRNNCFISIGYSAYFINNFQTSVIKDNCKIIIGDNFSCHGVSFQMHDEPNMTIKIGNDCMFSYDIMLRPADGHTILDKNGNILNGPKDIIIGNHVWICANSKILKGSHIPDNSIVGIGSIFTESSSKNSFSNKQNGGYIFAGSPAKMIKQNIQWSRENCYVYKQTHRFKT